MLDISHLLTQAEASNDLAAIRFNIKLALFQCGYIHFRTSSTSLLTAPTLISNIVSEFCTQIKVFDDKPIWREIKSKTDRPPNRSEGVGASFLHMDFVNAEQPPDYVLLFCVKADPYGGGDSLVAPIYEAIRLLDETKLRLLADPIFSDGRVEGLSHIGKDINPFPVFSPESTWEYRYTSNLISSAPTREHQSALLELSRNLEIHQQVVRLAPGDALFLDQHRVLHGKTALGVGQENIAESDRRLLLHGFFRRRSM